MKLLTVVGTAAMFLVGGGILIHGWPALHHALQAMEQQVASPWLAHPAGLLAEALTGVLAGALALVGVTLVQRLRR